MKYSKELKIGFFVVTVLVVSFFVINYLRGKDIFNKEIELVEQMEKEGSVAVLRPIKPIEVGRMERNTDKILALYNEGYDLAAQIEFEKE